MVVAGGLATAIGSGCAPEIPVVDAASTTAPSASSSESGPTESGSTIGVGTLDTSGDATATSGGGSSSDDTSTGTTPGWGRPEELVVLTDDGEDLVAFSLVAASDYVHLGALSPNFHTRHWVVHRETGEIVATSPVGGLLARSAGFVYATGFRNGGAGSPDAEWALNRMAHDGTGDTELLASAEAMYVRTAAPDGAFVERLVGAGQRELWRVEDEGGPAPIGDLAQVDVSLALFDEERLVVVDGEAMALASLDLVTLAAQPMAPLDDSALALAGNSSGVYVAGFETLVRAAKPDHATDVLYPETTIDVAADDAAVVWVSSTGPSHWRILAADAAGNDAVVVWEEDAAISHVALDSDALYFVRETPDVGTLVRIDRSSSESPG